MKVTPRAVKIYKPEVLNCPKCQSRLKYNYTISNKVVQFTSGRIFRIKNMGYSCPCCNDGNLYVSATANKLAFKGYTYSVKVMLMIYKLKMEHKSRDLICDQLASKGVEISDRNVDIISNKVKEFMSMDYEKNINDSYIMQKEKYGEVRFSVDKVSVDDLAFYILYDFYSGDLLALWECKDLEEAKSYFTKYLTNEVKMIITVRPMFDTYQILKKICPNAKMCSYAKF